MSKIFQATPAMDTFIRKHYKLKAPDLAKRFNAEFGTDRTNKQIGNMRKARGLNTGRTGQFYKGQNHIKGSGSKRANRTSFKKGSRPKNAACIGSEVTTKDGYLKVKIAEPNIWKFKHRLVWEQQHGEVEKGHVLWFIDQDRTNCNIENLMSLPRSLQVRLNKLKFNEQPEQLRETIMLMAKVQQRAGELKA